MTSKIEQAIEQAIADIMAIVDGYNGIDSDTIMATLVAKGHDGSVVNDAINVMEESGTMSRVSGQWYNNTDPLNIGGNITTNKTNKTKKENTMKTNETKKENAMKTNETKKENAMKTNETSMSIETIIENLKSGKKEETLKKAKADAKRIGISDTADIRTKKEFIDYLETCSTDTDNDTIVTSVSIETDEMNGIGDICGKSIIDADKIEPETPVKTRLQKRNDNRIAALQSCLDSLYMVLSGFDNTTLKQSKTRVSSILNTVSREYLDDGIIFKITNLNKHTIKKEYKLHLEKELIPEIQRALDEEHDLQDKEPTVITIDDKVKMLKPDTAMIMEQHDMKEKSRFDTLFNMMQEQDKKIKELTKLVQCHKDTISILLKRIETGNHTSETSVPVKETSANQPKKASVPEKTKEEIQAENREKYIKGLTGVDKAVFDLFNDKNALSEKNIIVSDTLEDYSPKMVKASLKKLVTVGLLECTRDVYSLASVKSFKVKKVKAENGKKADKTNKSASNETTKKTGKGFKRRTKKSGTVKAFIENLVSEGKHTRKEIIEKAVSNGFKEKVVSDTLSRGKSEKWCTFDSLIKENKKTGILSF